MAVISKICWNANSTAGNSNVGRGNKTYNVAFTQTGFTALYKNSSTPYIHLYSSDDGYPNVQLAYRMVRTSSAEAELYLWVHGFEGTNNNFYYSTSGKGMSLNIDGTYYNTAALASLYSSSFTPTYFSTQGYAPLSSVFYTQRNASGLPVSAIASGFTSWGWHGTDGNKKGTGYYWNAIFAYNITGITGTTMSLTIDTYGSLSVSYDHISGTYTLTYPEWVSPVYIKVNGEWKISDKVYIKSGGSWKTADKIYIKDSGAWKESQ